VPGLGPLGDYLDPVVPDIYGGLDCVGRSDLDKIRPLGTARIQSLEKCIQQ